MSNKLDAFFKSFADTEDQLDYRMAHETVGEKVPVISTGSLALDDVLSSGWLAKKLNAAYALEDYAEAKDALNTLHRELMDLNPSAARSLGEKDWRKR